jgi:nucleoside-diphosphate-sugar epimerase
VRVVSEEKNVLITGGAGYLGSHLSEILLGKGYGVTVLDSLLFGSKPIHRLINEPGFKLIQGDIRHIEDVSLAMDGVSSVIDLAAIVGAPACDKNGEHALETNYLATKLLANAAASKGVKRFLFASTCSVYGANDGKDLHEESPTKPLSLYAETKLKSEQALLSSENGLEPVILRLSTLCGPSQRMRFDLVLNIMTATAVVEGKVKVFGGSQWRPLLDVRDAARAFCEFLEAPKDDVANSVWNIGASNHNITIEQLAEEVLKQSPDAQLEEFPDVQDARSYSVNFNKLENFGFGLSNSLSQSIADVREMLVDGRIQDYRESRYYNSKLDY